MNHAPYDDCDKAKEGFCLFRNTMTAKPCGRSGSSLIQILICVAIIGLLASLLMPFFETALKNARSAKCVSNLRQLWHAGMLFAQEHNGRFCSLNIDKSENDAKSPGFREYLGYSSMLYKETAYSCPQAQRSEVAGGGYMFRSYGINRLTVANWAPADSGATVVNGALEHVLNVPHPSKTLYLADGVPNIESKTATTSGKGVNYFTNINSSNGTSANFIHADCLNAVFVDGHVSALRREDMAKPQGNALWGGNDPD